jgi:hypothetical protein
VGGEEGLVSEMSIESIDVRTVQQGLTQASIEREVVPPPGPIDGVWGSRTRASLDIFHADAGFPSANVASIPARATRISLDMAAAHNLRFLAEGYVPPTRTPTMQQPTSRELIAASQARAALLAPASGGGDQLVPILLGLGAAVVIVGGGYWLYTRSKRRRR